MKGFIKLWLHNASRIVLVVLAIIVIFVVIWWLDGTFLGYIGIGIWSLFCIISLLTLIEYKNK